MTDNREPTPLYWGTAPGKPLDRMYSMWCKFCNTRHDVCAFERQIHPAMMGYWVFAVCPNAEKGTEEDHIIYGWCRE